MDLKVFNICHIGYESWLNIKIIQPWWAKSMTDDWHENLGALVVGMLRHMIIVAFVVCLWAAFTFSDTVLAMWFFGRWNEWNLLKLACCMGMCVKSSQWSQYKMATAMCFSPKQRAFDKTPVWPHLILTWNIEYGMFKTWNWGSRFAWR